MAWLFSAKMSLLAPCFPKGLGEKMPQIYQGWSLTCQSSALDNPFDERIQLNLAKIQHPM